MKRYISIYDTSLVESTIYSIDSNITYNCYYLITQEDSTHIYFKAPNEKVYRYPKKNMFYHIKKCPTLKLVKIIYYDNENTNIQLSDHGILDTDIFKDIYEYFDPDLLSVKEEFIEV